jgi:hypothetical protein
MQPFAGDPEIEEAAAASFEDYFTLPLAVTGGHDPKAPFRPSPVPNVLAGLHGGH